jgi:PAS domain S-box-containing protein
MNKQFYESIINSLQYAFLVIGKELKVIYCNRSCEMLLSISRDKILGRDLIEIIPNKELLNHVRSVLQDNMTKSVEMHLDNQELKILKAVIATLGVKNQNGGAFCLITLEDISERMRLEEQLIQSEKSEGMGLLAATIAHELGNPLSIMGTTLKYIRDNITNQTIPMNRNTEAIDIIMDSIGQMHGLLRNLSEFNGMQRPHLEAVDIRRVLSQMLAFIRKKADAHKVNIYHQFEDNIPDCYVVSRDIKQVFLNLLKNAIEAMPDGGNLYVKLFRADEKEAIGIDISDTGCGISEAELRTIFRPFYSTKTDGKGLGLPLCRRILDEHGGIIKVESELGKGSTFRVILPIKQDVSL